MQKFNNTVSNDNFYKIKKKIPGFVHVHVKKKKILFLFLAKRKLWMGGKTISTAYVYIK